MSLYTEWTTFGEQQQYSGFLAQPAKEVHTLPAVLVIQEIWGVDEHIQDVTKRFAQAGYVAFAPDLYATNGKRPEAIQADRVEAVKKFLESLPPTTWGSMEEREKAISQLPEPKQGQIRETFSLLFGDVLKNMQQFVEKLTAAAAFLRNEYKGTKNQSVGSVGFCMGGALSALLACNDPALKAAVIFYGNAPDVEMLSKITCPVMGFYGELDKRITDAVPAFAQSMQDAGKQFEYYVYKDAHHAFFNDSRVSYNATAARDAFARVLAFFNNQLS